MRRSITGLHKVTNRGKITLDEYFDQNPDTKAYDSSGKTKLTHQEYDEYSKPILDKKISLKRVLEIIEIDNIEYSAKRLSEINLQDN